MSFFVLSGVFLCIPALCFVHEVGHLIAARFFAVRVQRLSIGLGSEILGITDRFGTRWMIAILPVGGSVEHQSFSKVPLNQRAAIYAAGPLFSLLFAVAIYGVSPAIFPEGTFQAAIVGKPAAVLMGMLSGFSLALALFNLIPIPPRDGGWLALFGIEAVKGKPIPERIQRELCAGGMTIIVVAMIISILGFASYVVAANVRFWPKADIGSCTAHVCFRG